MQASVTDYFKAKKRVREPENLLGKSSKLLAASSPTESGQDVPVPVEPVKDVKPLVKQKATAIVQKSVQMEEDTKRKVTVGRRKKLKEETTSKDACPDEGAKKLLNKNLTPRQEASVTQEPAPRRVVSGSSGRGSPLVETQSEVRQESSNSANIPSSPVRFVHKGMLSPKKHNPAKAESSKPGNEADIKKLLKNKGKLADLQAALKGINGCSEKLAEFRRNAAKRNAEAAAAPPPSSVGTASSTAEKSCVTPDKFYSPRKNANIFDSPTKLFEIMSPAKALPPPPGSNQIKKRLFETTGSNNNNSGTKKLPPAYQRFHNLAQKSETAVEGESPPTDPASLPSPTLPLPFKFKVLEEIFNAVETVTSILHNRKELITFSKLKAGVLELVRKGLKQSQLGQILTVFPECYSMSQEKVKVQGVSSYQLVITVKNLRTDESMTAATMTLRRKTFRQNLINICHQFHKAFLATLQPPIVIPDDKSITRWHPRFMLDDVPDVVGVPVPAAPQVDKMSSAKDVINRAQHILENANPRMKKAVQEMLNKKSAEENNKINAETLKKPQKELENKKTLKALKGISSSLIEKIRAREQEKSIRALTLTPEQSKKKKMLAKLPEFIKIIRNSFVAEKKAALSMQVAVERISHSGYGTMTQGEVEDHVRLLSTVLPEWLKIHRLSQGDFIKIEQRMDINELIVKLQEVARNTS